MLKLGTSNQYDGLAIWETITAGSIMSVLSLAMLYWELAVVVKLLCFDCALASCNQIREQFR